MKSTLYVQFRGVNHFGEVIQLFGSNNIHKLDARLKLSTTECIIRDIYLNHPNKHKIHSYFLFYKGQVVHYGKLGEPQSLMDKYWHYLGEVINEHPDENIKHHALLLLSHCNTAGGKHLMKREVINFLIN